MKRLVLSLVLLVAVAVPPVQALADPSEYGIEAMSAMSSTTQAGAHPDFTINFKLKTMANGQLPAITSKATFELPPGLLGNPGAAPKCTAAQLVGTDVEDSSNQTGCPQDSQVGITVVELFNNGVLTKITEPVYNIEPGDGEPARLGFIGQSFPVFIDTELRSNGDYGVDARVEGVSALIPLLAAETTLWGVPADESHDGQRITAYEGAQGGLPQTPNSKRSSGLAPVPFMRNPTRCDGPNQLKMTAIPYPLPDQPSLAVAPLPANTGCGLLDFKPNLSLTPTTPNASSSAGLDTKLTFPVDGWQYPNLYVGADQRHVEVILPVGLTVNPSQAEGLGSCSQADFAKETASSAPNQGCPETSKIGSVTAKSPLLDEAAVGSVYVAKPNDNPFGTLIAIYLAVKIPERGVIVRLAGKVEVDPATGQLTTIFDDIPQLPVESLELDLREGARAPLATPSRCGTYTASVTFTSWAGQVVPTFPSFEVTRGPDGTPCPSGGSPFGPDFTAGTLDNKAGAHSPFFMRITRNDGERDFTRLSTTLPPGLTATLAGVSRCPNASIEAAKERNGFDELAAPSCPRSAEIGSILAGAGVGSALTFAKGKVYLAGPYRGAPLSAAAIVPAVAGPFDIGTVVTRLALRINPRTALVTADGSADPIPRILAGIPVRARDVRVSIDRPNFTLNPTSCNPFAVGAEIWGGGADIFGSLDDSSVLLADHFQAADCSALGFKPSLSIRLKGGTKRGGHPALRGVYEPRTGDANLAGLQLRLPRAAFLDQAHIRTICTRVQFAAKTCPTGAAYGYARVFTPLLEDPLEGPVYLRSSNHELPDLVADLRGLIDVEAVARIDSVNGGIRATFTDVPDAPIEKVIVSMQGARKGLIVNSTDLCEGKHLARGRFEGHNGKTVNLRPPMRAECAKPRKDRRHR